jgi:hypothetical protein
LPVADFARVQFPKARVEKGSIETPASYNFFREIPWLTESFDPEFRLRNRANPRTRLFLSAAAKLPLLRLTPVRATSAN